MLTVYQMLRDAARTYARYRETRDELANLSDAVARDLDIYPGDAEALAQQAVYGRAA